MTLAAESRRPKERPGSRLSTAQSRRRPRPRGSLLAQGEPLVWLTGGSLVLALLMIVGLLGWVFWQGFTTFWPRPVVALELVGGERTMGEVAGSEDFEVTEATLARYSGEARDAARRIVEREGGRSVRRLVRTANYELSGSHFRWIPRFEIAAETLPTWALIVERLEWGRFYGTPAAFLLDGEPVAREPEAVWERFGEHHDASRERHQEIVALEEHAIGEVNRTREEARLAMREAELEHGLESEGWREAKERYDEVLESTRERLGEIHAERAALSAENERYELLLETADGQEKRLQLGEIVRAFPANQLGWLQKVGVYLDRWWEFVSADPREANSEGGVWPAIFGTVLMTLIMTVAVVPFGVLAALYLREYAKQGPIVSAVRIAVNNLAGVPSIVFGVFGLGFFCYIIGAGVDELFYGAKLPNPTFGKGGLMWASLTLALLTLPVVIVATEESLAAVPGSMREGSYACGATKWQTIRRIVLPRAMPGVMTGAILAIARGAGEVAPLMLVGAVKLAPELPFDVHDWGGDLGPIPTGALHLERSFMHLGFHVYDLGFQSQNSEAAKPMVYTTVMLLIAIIVVLNLLAIWIRARLRRKFQTSHV